MGLVDKKRPPTGKIIKSQQVVTWAFIILPFALYLLELFIDEQCKAVHQGTEV